MPVNKKYASLEEQINNLVLTEEQKQTLDELECIIRVDISPHQEKPRVIVISAEDSKIFCSFKDFKKVSQYRRIFTGLLKEHKHASTISGVVNDLAKILHLTNVGSTSPGPMGDKFKNHFNDLRIKITRLNENMESVEDLDEEYGLKAYTESNSAIIGRILIQLMENCVEGRDFNLKDEIKKECLERGVPSWLFAKLCNGNNFVTSKEQESILSSYFPRSSTTKGISFKTYEFAYPKFMDRNYIVTNASKPIIGLIKSRLFAKLIEKPKGISTDAQTAIDIAIDEVSWNLINPEEADRCHAFLKGKKPESFSFSRDSSAKRVKSGANADLSARRKIVGRLEHLNHLLTTCAAGFIFVEDPLNEFWSKIITEASKWELSAKHDIPYYVKSELAFEQKLQKFASVSDEALNKILFNVVVLRLDFVDPENVKGFVENIVETIKNELKPEEAVQELTDTTHLSGLQEVTVEDYFDDEKKPSKEDMELAKNLRIGKKPKAKGKKKLGNFNKTGVVLSIPKQKRLAKILGKSSKGLSEAILKWLGENFRGSGSKEKFQDIILDQTAYFLKQLKENTLDPSFGISDEAEISSAEESDDDR